MKDAEHRLPSRIVTCKIESCRVCIYHSCSEDHIHGCDHPKFTKFMMIIAPEDCDSFPSFCPAIECGEEIDEKSLTLLISDQDIFEAAESLNCRIEDLEKLKQFLKGYVEDEVREDGITPVCLFIKGLLESALEEDVGIYEKGTSE